MRGFGGELPFPLCLHLDAVQRAFVTQIGRRILYHADDVGVVHVFGIEEIDMATAAALGTGIGILAIVHFAAVSSLFLFLLQLGKALLFFGWYAG